MLIRYMTREDLPQAAAIEAHSITPPWSEQSFADALEQDTLMLVACEGDEVLGYVNMYLSFEEGEITNVAVRPDRRGQGISRQLMQTAVEEARRRGVERIVLEVRDSNAPAIGLYESSGFVLLGVRKNFYEFPREDARIMELTIC